MQTLPLGRRGADMLMDGRDADIAVGWTGCRHCRWVDMMLTLLMDGWSADIARESSVHELSLCL